MFICDKCGEQGDIKGMVKCPSCGKTFHKIANCVAPRVLKYDKPKQCPLCKQETDSMLGRFCPACGEHLWTYHIDCGGSFCE